MRPLIIALALSCTELPLAAQDQNNKCFFVCSPTVKIEPTFTWENIFRRPRIAETDSNGNTTVDKPKRERVFETILAVDVPTTVARMSFTFETSFKPFEKGNSPQLETELNLHWLRADDTNGWIGSHFDIVDQYSPGGRPHNVDIYTHKLNFELDTAVAFLKWTKKAWLSDIEIETSMDYVATGLPHAGDRFGNITYLDNAGGWSFSLVFVIPIAPLR